MCTLRLRSNHCIGCLFRIRVKVSAFSLANRKVFHFRTYQLVAFFPSAHRFRLFSVFVVISIRLWSYFAVIGQRDVRNYIFSINFVLRSDSRHQSPPCTNDPHSLAMLSLCLNSRRVLDSTEPKFVEWFNNGFADTHLRFVRKNSLVDALRPDARFAPIHGLQ